MVATPVLAAILRDAASRLLRMRSEINWTAFLNRWITRWGSRREAGTTML